MPSVLQLRALTFKAARDKSIFQHVISQEIEGFCVQYRAKSSEAYALATLVGERVAPGYGEYFDFAGQSLENKVRDLVTSLRLKTDLSNLRKQINNATGKVVRAIISDDLENPCVAEYMPCITSKCGDVIIFASIDFDGEQQFDVERAKCTGQQICHTSEQQRTGGRVGFKTCYKATTAQDDVLTERGSAASQSAEVTHKLLIIRLRSQAISKIEIIWLTTAMADASLKDSLQDSLLLAHMIKANQKLVTSLHKKIIENVKAKSEADQAICDYKKDEEITKVIHKHAEETMIIRDNLAQAVRDLTTDFVPRRIAPNLF